LAWPQAKTKSSAPRFIQRSGASSMPGT
jgi:hypothetical protein